MWSLFWARNPTQKATTPREDGTVRLLWVWSFSGSESGTSSGATTVERGTPETMFVVLSVVVALVLLLWLLLVLVVVVAVVVVVVVVGGVRSMCSVRGDSRVALRGCMQAIDPASWLRDNQFDADPPHPTVAVP